VLSQAEMRLEVLKLLLSKKMQVGWWTLRLLTGSCHDTLPCESAQGCCCGLLRLPEKLFSGTQRVFHQHPALPTVCIPTTHTALHPKIAVRERSRVMFYKSTLCGVLSKLKGGRTHGMESVTGSVIGHGLRD
jgi:hypothetical protein